MKHDIYQPPDDVGTLVARGPAAAAGKKFRAWTSKLRATYSFSWNPMAGIVVEGRKGKIKWGCKSIPRTKTLCSVSLHVTAHTRRKRNCGRSVEPWEEWLIFTFWFCGQQWWTLTISLFYAPGNWFQGKEVFCKSRVKWTFKYFTAFSRCSQFSSAIRNRNPQPHESWIMQEVVIYTTSLRWRS